MKPGRLDSLAEVASEPAGPLAPPPEVLVAIALAVEECWPRARPTESVPQSGWPWAVRPAWRFAGRPWAKPGQLRRERP